MLNRQITVVLLVLASLSSGIFSVSTFAQSARTQARVYFPAGRKHTCGDDNIHCFRAVARDVSASDPVLGALKALLDGPTKEEAKTGMYAPDTEYLRISHLSIARGTVHVGLQTTRKEYVRFFDRPGMFRQAINRTLMQFPGVSSVTICLDGFENFDSENDTPRRCSKMKRMENSR